MSLEKDLRQRQFPSEYEKMSVNIYYTHTWVQANNAKVFKPYGLSTQQFNVLRILRGQHPNPATVNLLRDRMIDKMSNASRLVEKLRQKGLIERKACGNDRRAVDIVITQKGLEILLELDVKLKELNKKWEILTHSEAKQLNFLLDKLRGSETE